MHQGRLNIIYLKKNFQNFHFYYKTLYQVAEYVIERKELCGKIQIPDFIWTHILILYL